MRLKRGARAAISRHHMGVAMAGLGIPDGLIGCVPCGRWCWVYGPVGTAVRREAPLGYFEMSQVTKPGGAFGWVFEWIDLYQRERNAAVWWLMALQGAPTTHWWTWVSECPHRSSRGQFRGGGGIWGS